jgi:hypothetical protein
LSPGNAQAELAILPSEVCLPRQSGHAFQEGQLLLLTTTEVSIRPDAIDAQQGSKIVLCKGVVLHRTSWEGNEMMRTASCHCGQLSLNVEGEPALVSACSCTRCQRRSGSAFSLTSRWNKDQVKGRSGNSMTYARKGESGGSVECIFCPLCGSTVSTALELLPDLVGIPVGCFADPTFPEPKVAAWCDSKLEWIQFPRGVLLLRDQSRPMETQ